MRKTHTNSALKSTLNTHSTIRLRQWVTNNPHGLTLEAEDALPCRRLPRGRGVLDRLDELFLVLGLHDVRRDRELGEEEWRAPVVRLARGRLLGRLLEGALRCLCPRISLPPLAASATAAAAAARASSAARAVADTVAAALLCALETAMC